MRAQTLVKVKMRSFAEQMKIQITQNRRETVRIVANRGTTIRFDNPQSVGEPLGPPDWPPEQSIGMQARQIGNDFVAFRSDHTDGSRSWPQSPHHKDTSLIMETKKTEGIVMIGMNHRFDSLI
jgi:hypothetical protein